jgi:2-dehydro-3-deoxyglucarate aldolase
MNDRLGELLDENKALFGIVCRDATHTDLELMAQTGYHIVWIDLEHGPQSMTQAISLARTAKHVGLVPLVRIVKLSRTHVQAALDGGFQIVTLPDVRDSAEAKRFVELGKYPPMGNRGVSTTSAGTDFSLGDDPARTLRGANDATHLMVMFESDDAYEDREAILAVDGIDLAIVGLSDWSISLGLDLREAASLLGPRVDHILEDVSSAGKTAAMMVATPDDVRTYADRGARVFFVGVDISMKRGMLVDRLGPIRAAVQ